MFQRLFSKLSSKLSSELSKPSRFSVPSTPLQIIISSKRNNILAILHHAMMVSGVAAITALLLMFIKPELTNQFQAISPFLKKEAVIEKPALISTATDSDPLINPLNVQVKSDKQQQSVTQWLSKRYRIAYDAADMLVSAAYLAATEFKLDPLLILSVMAIESGLNPFAESAVGAQGLMQVMSKVHHEKFEDVGGIKAALDPVANIRVGARILKEYVTRGGSVEAGLKIYVGAALAEHDGGYGNKVMAEYRRLKDVSNGKFVSTFTVASARIVTKAPSATVKEKEIHNEPEQNVAEI